MKMGRLGVWAQVDCMTASAEAEFARDVEQWGYSALWTPEAMGRDVLVIAQTAAARAVLGPNKLLCVEQKVLLETNAASAREVARAYLRPYLRLSNYVNSWRASTTAISPTMGRIDSSARWSRGAMKMRSSGASASTGRRARITSAFKRCMRIRANRRSMDPIST